MCVARSIACIVFFLGVGFMDAAVPTAENFQLSEPRCGTEESLYAPCLDRPRADALFSHCCKLHVSSGCHSLCTYETDKITAREALINAVQSKQCSLEEIGAVLYCASQNQDNRQCCKRLGLANPQFGVGNRCLRFCDPAEGNIRAITPEDLVCLLNWDVISYCAHSGIPFEH